MHYFLLPLGLIFLGIQLYKVMVTGNLTLSYRRKTWFTYSYHKIDLEDYFSEAMSKAILIIIGSLQFGMFVFIWSMIEHSS